jgi:hypothetical protein
MNVETFVENGKATCGVRHRLAGVYGIQTFIGEPIIVGGLTPEQATTVAQALRDAYRYGQSNGAQRVIEAARKARDYFNV